MYPKEASESDDDELSSSPRPDDVTSSQDAPYQNAPYQPAPYQPARHYAYFEGTDGVIQFQSDEDSSDDDEASN